MVLAYISCLAYVAGLAPAGCPFLLKLSEPGALGAILEVSAGIGQHCPALYTGRSGHVSGLCPPQFSRIDPRSCPLLGLPLLLVLCAAFGTVGSPRRGSRCLAVNAVAGRQILAR